MGELLSSLGEGAAAAILVVGTLTALVGVIKDRRKDSATASSLVVGAAGDAVGAALAVLTAVRLELADAHAEARTLRGEIIAWERHAQQLEDEARQLRARLNNPKDINHAEDF